MIGSDLQENKIFEIFFSFTFEIVELILISFLSVDLINSEKNKIMEDRILMLGSWNICYISIPSSKIL